MLFTAALFEVVQDNVRTNDLAHPGFAIQIGEVYRFDAAERERIERKGVKTRGRA